MKKLFICETPFQIIVAMCIKEQYFKKDDICDILLTDTIKDYKIIGERIKNKNIFDTVITANVKNIIMSNDLYNNFKKIFYILFPKLVIKKANIDINYQEIYSWNYDSFTASIRSYYELSNHHVKYYLFDEGYISYFPLDEVVPIRNFMSLIENRNKLFGISHIVRNKIDGIYLFEPDLLIYKPNCKVYKIDRTIIKNKRFIENINDIFEVNDLYKNYDKKYIIFEEAMLSDDENFDDERILENVINKLGKDNVIVKLHPRTKVDRFSDKGIKTLGNDGIPWEALVIVGNFEKKVLISIGSGSIPNYKIFLGDNANGVLLFDIYKPNLKYMNIKYNQFWNKIKTDDGKNGIFIPHNEEELDTILNKIRSE